MYLHGGVMGWLTGALFAGSSRPLSELRATDRAHRAGVSVPEVLAAYHGTVGGVCHRGYLLTREVVGARDLVQVIREGESAGAFLRAVGRETRKLHDAGVVHAGLHVKNVIDFDAARVLGEVPAAERHANLVRFDRSLAKLGRAGAPMSRQDRLRVFAGYYDGGIEDSERVRLVRRCRRSLGRHRLWWRITGQ